MYILRLIFGIGLPLFLMISWVRGSYPELFELAGLLFMLLLVLWFRGVIRISINRG